MLLVISTAKKILVKYLYLNHSFVGVFHLIVKLQGKSKVTILLGQILALSVLEMLSIAVIVPVMKVLLDDDVQIHFQSLINIFFGVDVSLFAVKCIVVLILITVFTIKIFGIYYIYKSQVGNLIDIQKKIGSLILKNTIGRGYQKMDRENASGTMNLLNHDIDLVTNNYILPSLILMSEFLTIILILISLMYYAGLNIIIAGLFAVISINFINRNINKKLSILGIERSKFSNEKLMFLQDIYGFGKELFSFKINDLYCNKYSVANKNYLDIERAQILYKSIPRLVIEFVVIFLFSLGLLFIIFQEQDLNALIPLMAMMAIALFRLMPSLNRIYGCTSNIKYSESIFKKIFHKIEFFEKKHHVISQKLLSHIHVEKIQAGSIRYEDITLINKQINIVYGRSGIGKTTFADLICGLLEIDDGIIHFNGRVMNNFDPLSVSYVTQQNYFIAGSIKENLAISNQFASEIRMQNLLERIGLKNELQERFGVEEILNSELSSVDTDLSGGQYQRLAIVRGILRDADIYVFDEPTSALDGESRERVLFAIAELAKEKMVIIVSHDNELIGNNDYQLIDLGKHVAFV